MENNLQNDPAFDKVTEISVKDTEISREFVTKLIDLLKNELNENTEFGVKHGYLSLSRGIIALSQSLCENREEYLKEMEKAQDIATKRIMPAILPKVDKDEIIDENYDMDDLSIRRIMMTIGTVIDYVFWRSDLAQYSEIREEIEKEEIASDKE